VFPCWLLTIDLDSHLRFSSYHKIKYGSISQLSHIQPSPPSTGPSSITSPDLHPVTPPSSYYHRPHICHCCSSEPVTIPQPSNCAFSIVFDYGTVTSISDTRAWNLLPGVGILTSILTSPRGSLVTISTSLRTTPTIHTTTIQWTPTHPTEHPYGQTTTNTC